MAGIPRKVLDHFAAVPLFSRVPRRHLREVVAAADEVTVPDGTALVTEGEHGRHMYVLIEGNAVVKKGGRKINTLGPGDFFGELALLSGAPRSATVTADGDVTVMVLDPRRFEVVMEQEPAVAKAVMATMAERLRSAERSHAH